MLVESASRSAALQCFLSGWQPVLHATLAQPASDSVAVIVITRI